MDEGALRPVASVCLSANSVYAAGLPCQNRFSCRFADSRPSVGRFVLGIRTHDHILNYLDYNRPATAKGNASADMLNDMFFKPSPEQAALFEFVRSGEGNAALEACAAASRLYMVRRVQQGCG